MGENTHKSYQNEKEPYNATTKNQQPTQKWARGFNRHMSKEDMQMAQST